MSWWEAYIHSGIDENIGENRGGEGVGEGARALLGI